MSGRRRTKSPNMAVFSNTFERPRHKRIKGSKVRTSTVFFFAIYITSDMWPRTLTSWKQCATKPSQFTANCKVWNGWMIVPSMIIKLPWVNDLRSTIFSDYTYGFSILPRCICYKQNINPQTKWYMVMPYFCRCSTPVKVNKSHTRLVLVFYLQLQ